MPNLVVTPRSTGSPDFSALLEEDCLAVTAHVIFGSPHKNCAGSGICKTIMPSAQEADSVGPPLVRCDSARAIIQYRHPDLLCFYFENASLCKKTRTRHFGQNRFLVESPVLFVPPQANYSFWVDAGEYPVQQWQSYLRVAFVGSVSDRQA